MLSRSYQGQSNHQSLAWDFPGLDEASHPDLDRFVQYFGIPVLHLA